MACNNSVLLLLAMVLTSVVSTKGGDPDILSDHLVSNPNSAKFTFTGLRNALLQSSANMSTFTVTRASQAEFPALTGLGVSYASLQFGPNSINGPHTHPRASEILFVLQGSLEVGLVDSANKLFTQVLNTGDMFVFPKGLVHFQRNKDHKYTAHAIAAFGSSNPGTVIIQKALFESGIADDVLAMAFNTDVHTIQKLMIILKEADCPPLISLPEKN